MRRGSNTFARRLSCPEVAKLAARALVKHGFNATRAAKELRPHLTEQSARKTGSRMISTPAVLAEVERLMEDKGLGERNSKEFIDRLWDWFLGEDKALKQTAARILGRGYVQERLEVSPPQVIFVEGLADIVGGITGEPIEEGGEEHGGA